VPEDLCLVERVGAAQDFADAGELVNDGPDLSFGHAPASHDLAHAELVLDALGFGLGDPLADRGRAAA
jgi:hypothetical protein